MQIVKYLFTKTTILRGTIHPNLPSRNLIAHCNVLNLFSKILIINPNIKFVTFYFQTFCKKNADVYIFPSSIVAIQCPPIPVWEGIELNSTVDNIYHLNTIVNYTCTSLPEGHANTGEYLLATCSETGQWTPGIICYGKCTTPLLTK